MAVHKLAKLEYAELTRASGTNGSVGCLLLCQRNRPMAKKRKYQRKPKTQSTSLSLLDPTSLKLFFNTPAGRQLMADMFIAAAGVAAAALLASNRGGKAMGKAAMGKAQEAVMGLISNSVSGNR